MLSQDVIKRADASLQIARSDLNGSIEAAFSELAAQGALQGGACIVRVRDIVSAFIHDLARLAWQSVRSAVEAEGGGYRGTLAGDLVAHVHGHLPEGLGHRILEDNTRDMNAPHLDGAKKAIDDARLLEPIGYVPPVEFEEAYYRSQEAPAMVAGLT